MRLYETSLYFPCYFADFIQPICLPTPAESFEESLENQLAIVSGYGQTSNENRQTSRFLLQLLKPYVPYSQCRNINNLSSSIDPLAQVSNTI